jgi:hypothetical protein
MGRRPIHESATKSNSVHCTTSGTMTFFSLLNAENRKCLLPFTSMLSTPEAHERLKRWAPATVEEGSIRHNSYRHLARMGERCLLLRPGHSFFPSPTCGIAPLIWISTHRRREVHPTRRNGYNWGVLRELILEKRRRFLCL